MIASEVNFDGVVGPTHNYAGLAHGNLASLRNRGRTSDPKMAALQGLEKMKLLADMGIPQAVLPPQPRPDLSALRQLGFTGTDVQLLQSAARHAPQLLAACFSASAMWAANAATVSPSADTADGRVHFTPANLLGQFHRSLESPYTARILRAIFPEESVFAHHSPLPAAWPLADEGAANHLRLSPAHGRPGVEVFLYGRRALESNSAPTRRYPARQSLEASQAVARRHGLPASTIFLQQSPKAIDAGAFHNDVVAVANLNVLLYHAHAWVNAPAAVARIRKALRSLGADLVAIEVKPRQIPLAEAIRSYLFNSQIVSLPDGSMTLIAPDECRRSPRTRRFLDELPDMGTPVTAVRYIQVRQSMRNGGGPACLRLRVVLNARELAAVHPGVFLTSALHDQLKSWIHRHYRDRLSPADLADPSLIGESHRALDELAGILQLPLMRDVQQ